MENGSNGNGNGKHVDISARQEDIADAMLLRVMPRSGAGADLALLHALRCYVQEVVKQEVVTALSLGGELMQNMIKFQVSKQMKDSGLLDSVKEYVLEELQEKITDSAQEAAQSYLSDSDFVDRSDCESIAEEAADSKFEEIDYDDIAENVTRNLDTDEIAETVKRELQDDVEDLVGMKVAEALTEKFRPLFVEDPHCDACGRVEPASKMYRKHENKWWCTARCFKGAQETKVGE